MLKIDIQIWHDGKDIKHITDNYLDQSKKWLVYTRGRVSGFDFIDIQVYYTVLTDRGNLEHMPYSEGTFKDFDDALDFLKDLDKKKT